MVVDDGDDGGAQRLLAQVPLGRPGQDCRIDRWEAERAQRRRQRMLQFASRGDRKAQAELDTLRQAEAERQKLRAALDEELPNPLGRDKAELATMYHEQRVERALDWLRTMAQMGTQWGPRGF